MTNAIDGILQVAQNENPLFASWARPGNDVSVVIDRLLVNPEALNELFTGDYSATGEDPEISIKRWMSELVSLKKPRNVLSWRQRLQSFLFGKSFTAELMADNEERFQTIRDEFDELVSTRISALVNVESAVSWLGLLVDEVIGRGDLSHDNLMKLSILEQYRESLEQIARMDQAMILKLQTLEQTLDFTALKLSLDTAVATMIDTKVNLTGSCK